MARTIALFPGSVARARSKKKRYTAHPSHAFPLQEGRGERLPVALPQGLKVNAPVAQLDRVLVSEAKGRGFDSRRAHQSAVVLFFSYLILAHFSMKFLVFALLSFPALALASQDADFLAARDAFRAGNAAKLDTIAARLKRHPLEPYLAYYQLRMRLETATPAVIQAFLARSDDTPVIDRLRAEWLKLLARKQQWEAFTEEYPRLQNSDTGLTCYELQARGRVQMDTVLQEARAIWLKGDDELPESCTPLFDAAITGGIISEADIWQRLRLALKTGSVSLAKQLSRKLSAQRALTSSALDSAAADPERYLNKSSWDAATEGERLIALFALRRLAKQLPQLAYAQWTKIESNFKPEEREYFFGWLGYEAARKQDERALEWYRQAGDSRLNETQLAWRARASLRAQNWHETWASISTMSPEQQSEGVWRYWKGRALRELGRKADAEALFSGLSSEYNYYGQLAAEELGTASASGMVTASHVPDSVAIEAMQAKPAVQRVLALYSMDLRTDAALEWNWLTRKLDDKQLLIAAEIARRNVMYDHSINTADRTVSLHDFTLRYPVPYREEMRGHVSRNGLDEAWVYGLMRQESRFVTQAKSSAGAAGIMQVMPSTALWIAQKIGMKDYRKALIHQLDTNLKLGTYYMKNVLSSLDNNPLLASAAYNAGPRRARQWRGESKLEGAIYAETIPFDETRIYVKKVMSNTVYYAKLLGQPPQSLKQRLGVIEPANSAGSAASADE